MNFFLWYGDIDTKSNINTKNRRLPRITLGCPRSAVTSVFSFYVFYTLSASVFPCCHATANFWRKRLNSWSSPWQVTVRTLVKSMLRIPRIDFASIITLLYEISTSKSHLLAACTNSFTSAVSFNLIFWDINFILSSLGLKKGRQTGDARSLRFFFVTSHLVVSHYVSCCRICQVDVFYHF